MSWIESIKLTHISKNPFMNKLVLYFINIVIQNAFILPIKVNEN